MEMIVKLMNNFNKKMIKKSNIFKLNNSVFCDKNWITVMSLGNKLKNDDLMYIQSILNLISIFGIIILLQILRKKQRLM